MNTATPFPWSDLSPTENGPPGFRSIFELAPMAAARCNREGVIIEVNPAFEQALDPDLAKKRALRLCDLVSAEDRDTTESLLHTLLDSTCNSIRIEAKRKSCAADGLAVTNWTAWRLPGAVPDALLIAEPNPEIAPLNESLVQTQRWEAVGRLAGGVVHDFNNVLTGVMLYSDLLLSSLDERDCRRRYAVEIRTAVLQASGLVRQLLVFARPQASQVRTLSLNQIAHDMQDLLTRLIGGNVELEFRLDPDLGLLSIDQAQAQQIILNLVLNARDALSDGGRIVVETSNCSFKTVTGSPLEPRGNSAFPCIQLVVSDNGRGMDAKTRERLFEPFFTTKGAGQGTGLGLTTVKSIVTANRGLIHIESEPGQGTRVMILLPQASPPAAAEIFKTVPPSGKPFQAVKKESLL
jgi:two-component system, cell cycle sensor histidine kinase and response regulator CckA